MDKISFSIFGKDLFYVSSLRNLEESSKEHCHFIFSYRLQIVFLTWDSNQNIFSHKLKWAKKTYVASEKMSEFFSHHPAYKQNELFSLVGEQSGYIFWIFLQKNTLCFFPDLLRNPSITPFSIQPTMYSM